MSHKSFYVATLAGAGTGKTYCLVENYLSALFGLDESGVKKRPREILALTFTQKAAHEMRIRITKRLSHMLSANENEDPLWSLMTTQMQAIPDKDEIKRLLRALPNAPIATFHGFCSMLLQQEAEACGVDSRYDILAPRDELILARNVLRPIILNHIEADNSQLSSIVARFRLSANLSSLGLIDGVLDLYFRLFEQGLDTARLEALTIKNVSNNNNIHGHVDEVIYALTKFKAAQVSLSTQTKLDNITNKLNDFVLALHDMHEQNVTNSYLELRHSVKGNFGDNVLRAELVSSIVNLGAKLVDYFIRQDEVTIVKIISQFDQQFSAYKNNIFLMSYSDLLFKTKEALVNNLSLRKKIKDRISHILVDEYQDTSPIQQDIISLLLENKQVTKRLAGCHIFDEMDFSNGASLFVVGDKKQSIYGFRGANVSLFDNLVHKIQNQENFSKRLLTVNRRSAKPIIDLVNLVASHTLSSQGYSLEHALKPSEHNLVGQCALWVLEAADQELDKTRANLTCAAYGIANLLSERKDIAAKDIIVLTRRIKSAYLIKQILSTFNVAAQIVGGEGFFSQQEVVDLLSALKLIHDPNHQLACAVVLRSPLVLLSDEELLQVANHAYGFSLLSLKDLATSAILKSASQQRLNRFLRALSCAETNLIKDGLAQALDTLIDQCDLGYMIGLHDDADQKWANIEKLRAMLVLPKKNPFCVIDQIYQQISLPDKEPQAPSHKSKDAVTIMTIHQSKGLEFNVVVLADGEASLPANYRELLGDKDEGLVMKPKGRAIAACLKSFNDKSYHLSRFEHVKNKIKQAEQEEMARLLYVALTRAKHELYVACSPASFNAKGEELSLVGLFLRAFRQSRDEFLRICDVKMVKKPPEVISTKEETPDFDEVQSLNLTPDSMRLFASQLLVSEASEIKSLIRSNVSKPGFYIDGDLAHQLLSAVGSAFLYLNNDNYLFNLLDAALRDAGEQEHSQTKETKLAVAATLTMLKTNLSPFFRAIFEMPLCVWPLADVMIEGFADLVVECDDFIGVVEFKTSQQRATDANTYFQVMAYAHALAAQFSKPIKYAIVLVGAGQEINWQNYDVRARSLFLAALEQMDYKAIKASDKFIPN